MKRARLALALVFCLTQLACGIGGHTMTGMVLEKDLKAIKPHLQYYEKPGWTSEGRRLDAAACGASGDASDRASIGSARVQAAQRPDETEKQTEARLGREWHACMVEKGYRDIRASSR